MKLKRWFFDATAFKKDLTRFAPFWALYLIGALLISMPILSMEGSSRGVVGDLNATISILAVVNMIYAIISAQLVFGDLFNSRLCHALHALPLRRETWFSTHLLSGLLFSFGPNAALTLLFLGFTGEYPQAALMWMVGVDLSYLFFFCLAVLCMQCTGSRFAAVTVYLILNFLSILLMWFAVAIYEPLLYGVKVDEAPFLLLSPVVTMAGNSYFSLKHDPNCWCHASYPDDTYDFTWQGSDCNFLFTVGNGWTYMAIAVAVGLVLAVLALVLYRRRRLETAGDFVAFRKLRPLFWVIFSICAGWLWQLFASGLMGTSDSTGYLFFIIGAAVGFFVGHMLLERTVKVFRGKAFVKLTVLFVALGLSLGLVSLDPVGITRRVPAPEKTEGVLLVEGDRTEEYLEKVYEGSGYGYRNKYLFKDFASIEQATKLHKQLIDEGDSGSNYQTISLYYRMKDGSSLVRYYKLRYNSQSYYLYRSLIIQDKYGALGAGSLAQLQGAEQVELDGRILSGVMAREFLGYIWADATNGCLVTDETTHLNHGCQKPLHYLHYYLNGRYYEIPIWECFVNTCGQANRYVTNDQLLKSDPESFFRSFTRLECHMGVCEDEKLAELLAADYEENLVNVYGDPKEGTWISASIWGEKLGDVGIYLAIESKSWQYIESLLTPQY